MYKKNIDNISYIYYNFSFKNIIPILTKGKIMTPINDLINAFKHYRDCESVTDNPSSLGTEFVKKKQESAQALKITVGRLVLASAAVFAVYASGVALVPAIAIGACLSTTITLLAVGSSSFFYGVATLIEALAATSFSTACVLTGIGLLALGVGIASLHFYRHKSIFSLIEYNLPSVKTYVQYDSDHKCYHSRYDYYDFNTKCYYTSLRRMSP